MMQIGSTLPVQNLHGLFQMRRSTSRCSGSPLNPSNNEMTKKHLSNLQKLLHVPSDTDPSESEPKARIQLEGLNLSRAVWPEAKSAEDMSPRHLNRLQRLLSKSPDHSPRNNLGSRWRDYHGRNDWAGLVDPLDENLRREVVRFGEFVQAAYHCFHSNPAMSDDEPEFPRHVAVPDRSYKVTKSLYATSGVGLPKWVDDVAPELGWMTQRSSWVGYVAVCDDRDEIRRMGRRDIVIALRGTATCLEWAENVRDVLVPLSSDEDGGLTNEDDDDDHHSAAIQVPKVECGFLSLFKTRGHEHNIPSLAESVVSEIQRLLEKYKGETLSISITGHSLGAALALLAGDAISTTCGPNVPPVAVFSFGGPRAGNRGFADRLGSNGVKVLRVVNSQDVITRVPGMLVSEDLDRKMRGSRIGRKVLDAVDGYMPWAYAHVGTELRVDTKMSPFLKPDADMACCHDLEAYLHLVDGFLSSSCPFRPNAKRSLWRLLHEQRSNFKRLYTSKSTKAAAGLRLGEIERDHRHMLVPSSCLPSPS